MANRLDQSTDARLAEIKDVIRSGVTELTGKAAWIGSAEHGERGRRIRGGMKIAFPELRYLKQQPGVIAKAIERGKGKVYRQVRGVVRREMSQHIPDTKPRIEKPTVPAHPKLTGKCETCGRMHGKGEHRFHGKGAFHKTHLFSFNPNMKTKHLRNPRGLTEIYGRVLTIDAQKTQVHRCDPGCARASHKYTHDFTSRNAHEYGLPAGSVIVTPDGYQYVVPERSLLISTKVSFK
jgi:hypothetical protein